MALAPRAAGGGDERVAIQQRNGIVIREHTQKVLLSGPKPGAELSFVGQPAVVRIVAVEKGDAHYLIGNRFHRVEITEDEAAAAAVTAKHDLQLLPGKKLCYLGQDAGDGFVVI